MGAEEKFISVIIPCYNKESFISEALDSVLNQTHTKGIKEIIVIDDGSTDSSAALIKEKASLFAIIRYLYQHNSGVSSARNTGIENAEGDYIAFLDADDLWMPEKIKTQCEALEKYPDTGLFYSDLFQFGYKQKKMSPVKVISYHHNEKNLLFKFVAKGAPVIPSTVLVKKICFQTEGLFDTSFKKGGEDIDMWLRIARNYSFQHVQGYLIKKRQLKNSLGENTYENAKGYKAALDKMQLSEPSIAPYRRKRDALIHYKVGLYFYKQGNNTEAVSQAKKSLKSDFKLYKAYVLWLAIIARKVLGIRIVLSI